MIPALMNANTLPVVQIHDMLQVARSGQAESRCVMPAPFIFCCCDSQGRTIRVNEAQPQVKGQEGLWAASLE